MKSVDKDGASVREPASHQFPKIGKQRDSQGDKTEKLCDLFEPLFETASTSKDKAHKPLEDNEAHRNVEKARKKGYQLGFEAGRKDACQLAGNILSPQMDQFQQAMKQLEACQQNIADHSSTHILQLALEVAERVLGISPEATLSDLQKLRNPIMDAIKKQYQLALRYNPQDLSNIQQLIDCEGGMPWQSSDSLLVTEDDTVPNGELATAPCDEDRPAVSEQLSAALQKTLNGTKSV